MNLNKYEIKMQQFMKFSLAKIDWLKKKYLKDKNLKTIFLFFTKISGIPNINIFLYKLFEIIDENNQDFADLYNIYKENKDNNIDEMIKNKYKDFLPKISVLSVNNLKYDYQMLFIQLIKLFVSNSFAIIYNLKKDVKYSIFNNELEKIQYFVDCLFDENISIPHPFFLELNPNKFYECFLNSLNWIGDIDDDDSIRNSSFLDEETICENLDIYHDLYNGMNKKFLILLNYFYYRVNILLLSGDNIGIEHNIELYEYIYKISDPIIILYSLIKSKNESHNNKEFFEYYEKFKLLEWEDGNNANNNYYKCGDEVRFKKKKENSRFNAKGKILSFSGKDDFSYYIGNEQNYSASNFKYTFVKNYDIKGKKGTRVIIVNKYQKIRNSTIDMILMARGSSFGINKKTYNNALKKINDIYKIGVISEVKNNGYLVKFDKESENSDGVIYQDKDMIKLFKPKKDSLLPYYDSPGEEVYFENKLIYDEVQNGKILEIFVTEENSEMLGGSSLTKNAITKKKKKFDLMYQASPKSMKSHQFCRPTSI